MSLLMERTHYALALVMSVQPELGGGKNLILRTNELITEKNIPGILFCRDKLVGFYSKYNWKVINPEQVTLTHLGDGINTMVLNINENSTIQYNDRNF